MMMRLITPDHPELIFVISLSIGMPSEEKIQRTLKMYKDFSWHLIGYFVNERLVGVIGLDLHPPLASIKHIGILPDYQGQGMGRNLIHFALGYFSITTLSAETDDDTVRFYQKLGFTCHPFEGTYGKRYKCSLIKLKEK